MAICGACVCLFFMIVQTRAEQFLAQEPEAQSINTSMSPTINGTEFQTTTMRAIEAAAMLPASATEVQAARAMSVVHPELDSQAEAEPQLEIGDLTNNETGNESDSGLIGSSRPMFLNPLLSFVLGVVCFCTSVSDISKDDASYQQ
jgi:hypothetical protein